MKAAQEESFANDIQALRPELSCEDVRKRKATTKKTSLLYRLDPFLDKQGVLRVGGHLTNTYTPFNIKHPIILLSDDVKSSEKLQN